MELEYREWEMDRLEIRGEGDGQKVRGQGVPFDRMSEDMGGWQEVIRQGAATQSLKEENIVMLWAHDSAQPISRVGATRHALELEERSSGVWFEQAAAAFTDFQLQKIDDGVVEKMSFGFFIEDFEKDQLWTEGGGKKKALREILKMNLREISPVVFPAYPSTNVALRSAIACGVTIQGDAYDEMRQHLLAVDERLAEADGALAEFERDHDRLRLAALAHMAQPQ
tara:strand:+ start:144 stop:818 length:675 start_codon:yes stop_codon:yes gene_type:complete